MSAGGLNPGLRDQVPPACDKTLADRRTHEASRLAMEQDHEDAALSPEMPATSAFLSPNLVTDVKSANFRWQNSHPLAMPSASFELHLTAVDSKESLDQATSAALADLQTTKIGPPPCQQDCVGCLQMLGSLHQVALCLTRLAALPPPSSCSDQGAVSHKIRSDTRSCRIRLLTSFGWRLLMQGSASPLTTTRWVTRQSRSQELLSIWWRQAGQVRWLIGTPLLTMFGDGQGESNPVLSGSQQRRAGGAKEHAPRVNNEDGRVHPWIAAAKPHRPSGACQS